MVDFSWPALANYAFNKLVERTVKERTCTKEEATQRASVWLAGALQVSFHDVMDVSAMPNDLAKRTYNVIQPYVRSML